MSRSNSPGCALAGAVEHHVLEEMREAGDARHFVAAADAHPVVERDVGDVAIGPDDDLHAVRQRGRVHLVGARHARGRRRLGVRRGRAARDAEQQQQAGSARDEWNFGMRHLEKRCATLTGSRKRKAPRTGEVVRGAEEANTGEELFAVLFEVTSCGDYLETLTAWIAASWARASRASMGAKITLPPRRRLTSIPAIAGRVLATPCAWGRISVTVDLAITE